MITFDVVARTIGAVLWIAVMTRYLIDVVSHRHLSTRGEQIVQTGLAWLFVLLAISAVRAIGISLQPSWLTYAFPASAVVMVIGQHWERLTAHRPRQ